MFKICAPVLSTLAQDTSISRSRVVTISVSNYSYKYEPPRKIDTSEWPPEEKRWLKTVEKQPNYGNIKPPSMPKMLILLRGPEQVHTDLLYKGWGVKALLGGRLQFSHFEAIRRMVNKKLDISRMYCFWRVEPPWQPLCKKAVGKRMGGGKGAPHHYCTPVRADRIIVELTGDLEEVEARRILAPVAEILPFAARVVSHESLRQEKENEKWVKEHNLNPYTFEYIIKNNMGGCKKWISKYDTLWFGKYK